MLLHLMMVQWKAQYMCVFVYVVIALTWAVGHLLIRLLLAAGPAQVEDALVSLQRKTMFIQCIKSEICPDLIF